MRVWGDGNSLPPRDLCKFTRAIEVDFSLGHLSSDRATFSCGTFSRKAVWRVLGHLVLGAVAQTYLHFADEGAQQKQH